MAGRAGVGHLCVFAALGCGALQLPRVHNKELATDDRR